MTAEEFFIKNGSKMLFKKDDVLIRSEEDPSGIYFLKSGIVKMSTFFASGTEITFNLFKPGSFFPMIWAIAETKNSYDFLAVTDAVTYRVPKKEVLIFLEKNKLVYSDLVKRILVGFDSLLTGLPYLLSGNSTKRVAMALLILGRRFGQRTSDGLVIGIKVRHEDLAGMAALTRETVSLTIEKMERKKIIQQKNRFIIIKEPEELKKEAGAEDFLIPALSRDVTI
jgi:CRP-like cAMP-binding protein